MNDTGYAKLNLALHVRHRRPDGYHGLETLFAFCADGDAVIAAPALATSLTIDGPFGIELSTSDNLMLRAAAALGVTARLHLTKHLPVASGVGGGSADAAAVLRLLGGTRDDVTQIARTLGADVAACLASTTALGMGVGDRLSPATAVTGTPVLLVNPRVPLATAAVFAGWDGVDHGPLTDWRVGRNDLQPAACRLVPEIAVVLDWLAARSGVTLARMSGSGATCFALFGSLADRDAAALAVPAAWWSLASVLR